MQPFEVYRAIRTSPLEGREITHLARAWLEPERPVAAILSIDDDREPCVLEAGGLEWCELYTLDRAVVMLSSIDRVGALAATSEIEWLFNCDRSRDETLSILAEQYEKPLRRWWAQRRQLRDPASLHRHLADFYATFSPILVLQPGVAHVIARGPPGCS